jgi:hypothetical protein
MITFGKGNLRIPKWSKRVFMVAGGCTPFQKYFPEYKLEELVMMGYKMMLEENNLKMSPMEIKDSASSSRCMASSPTTSRTSSYANPRCTTTWAWTRSSTPASRPAAPPAARPYSWAPWRSPRVMPTAVGGGLGAHGRGGHPHRQLLHLHRGLQGFRDPHGPHLLKLLRAHGQPLRPSLQPVGCHPGQDRGEEPGLRHHEPQCPAARRPHHRGGAGIAHERLSAALSGVLRHDRGQLPRPFCATRRWPTSSPTIQWSCSLPAAPTPCGWPIGGPWIYRFCPTKSPACMKSSSRSPALARLRVLPGRPVRRLSGLPHGRHQGSPGGVGLGGAARRVHHQRRADLRRHRLPALWPGDRLRGERRLLLHESHHRGPGKCPANLSGGLLGTMHAVGATGIWQAVECLWQLQGKYDQFHGDKKWWERAGKRKPKK